MANRVENKRSYLVELGLTLAEVLEGMSVVGRLTLLNDRLNKLLHIRQETRQIPLENNSDSRGSWIIAR
jgi:hypothetical protein